MIKSTVLFAFVAVLTGLAMSLPASDTDTRRIVNGTDTTIDRIPFQVSILFLDGQWCGAVILDENTLLTAAHCFEGFFGELYELSAWSVRAGSSYWAEGGELFQLASVVRHAQYNSRTYDFDVAIVQLDSNLTMSATVQPAVLADSGSELAAGQSVQISGWGRLTQGGSLPDVLQKIVLPALDRTHCEELFGHINPITDNMFCAGDLEGLGDSCTGDSGGPLVDLDDNVVYGLVSWGFDCAMYGFTGVYTNVPALREWIDANREIA